MPGPLAPVLIGFLARIGQLPPALGVRVGADRRQVALQVVALVLEVREERAVAQEDAVVADVRRAQGDGTYATSLQPSLLLEALSFIVDFHRDDPVPASLVDSMSLPTTRARVWRGMTEPHADEKTMEEHRAIYGAIMSRDPDLARSWATIHISGIESWLRLALAD